MSAYRNTLAPLTLAALLMAAAASADSPRYVTFDHPPTVEELALALGVNDVGRAIGVPEGTRPDTPAAPGPDTPPGIKDGPQPASWIPENVEFENGSNRILSTQLGIIDRLGTLLQEKQDFVLVISGHANATGPDAVNDRLSMERSKAVAAYISTMYKIPQERFDLRWKGARDPLPGTPAAAPQNRRVQFGALPSR